MLSLVVSLQVITPSESSLTQVALQYLISSVSKPQMRIYHNCSPFYS